MARTPSSARSASSAAPRPSDQRKAASELAERRQETAQRRRRARWGAGAGAVLIAALVGAYLFNRGNEITSSAANGAAPVVGGDLHTVMVIQDALYVGGHAAAVVSHDGGRRWASIPSLDGADAMGWAVTPSAVLVGGHPGLFRSTDNGSTFSVVSGAAAVPDVHALGGTGNTLYLGSPQAGLLASTDGGLSWQVRNAAAGRSFMGTILVDPTKPARLIAPDMSTGLTASADGGRTWTPLGGPKGAMAAAWNPIDPRVIVAVGMGGSARSSDGGATWQPVAVPTGTSAVAYAPDGRTLYAGALDGEQALTFRSTDGGATWAKTT